MLKKSKLNQTERYAMCIAANKAAEMVVAFIQRRSHDLEIGSEQGPIDVWDDLVIAQPDDTYEHLQVKRQETNFDDRPTTRALKSGTMDLQDQTPLDKTLEALAVWTLANDPATSSPKRKFVIEILSSALQIKRGLQIRHLANFCANEISPSTTVTKLAALQTTSTEAASLFEWLTSWCGFKDWAHILRAFRHLTIKVEGSESDIDDRTITTLSHCFVDPQNAKAEILSALDQNSSFTSAITPRLLLGALQAHLLPNLSVWTQYAKSGNDWSITGTADMTFDSVESAASVVGAHWEKNKKSELKLCISNIVEEPMLNAMVRLMIHMPALAGTYVSNAALWQEKARSAVHGTLGLSADDITDINIVEDDTRGSSGDCRILDKLALSTEEAERLNASMDKHTWELVCEQLEQKITVMRGSELRNAIDTRWRTWKSQLCADEELIKELCRHMVHPRAEGAAVKPAMRLGLKTLPLIVEGFFLLLAVSTALCDDDSNWSHIQKKYTLEVKVGKYWSGPETKARKVRKLFSDDGFDSLLAKEPANILLLSGVEAGQSELRDAILSDGKQQDITLATPKQPVLIVANSSKIEGLIERGELAPLKQYLESFMVEPQQDNPVESYA